MWKEMLRAARFARTAHGAQMRACGTVRYYRHPMAVAAILWNKIAASGKEPSLALIQAAYLHDTLEDTSILAYELEAAFGTEVFNLVYAVTKTPGQSYESYYEKIKASGNLAMMLKVADRYHNNSQLQTASPKFTELKRKAKEKTAIMLRVFFGG